MHLVKQYQQNLLIFFFTIKITCNKSKKGIRRIYGTIICINPIRVIHQTAIRPSARCDRDAFACSLDV